MLAVGVCGEARARGAATIHQVLMATSRKHFGEYLVERRVLDRYQLLRALQLQDRKPNVPLGRCAVALGFAHGSLIERLHAEFVSG